MMRPRIFLLLAMPALAAAGDASLGQRMESATVKILCPLAGGQVRTGSGVILGDARHVVTNFHLAGDVACLVALGDKPTEVYPTRILAADRQKDLAILETARDLPRSPVLEAAPHSTISKADRVYVLGFPAAAEIRGIQPDSTFFEVKITSGIISAFVKSQSGTDLYQTDAGIHPGNSGGPLFNACGQLAGINVAKSSAGEGIGYSIVYDELRPLVERAGIRARVTEVTGVCVAAGAVPVAAPVDWVTRGLLILVLVMGSVGLLLLAARRRARQAARESAHRFAEPPPRLILRGVAGEFAGTDIPLDDGRPLTIGRDPRQCRLVFAPDVDAISKLHCLLRHQSAGGILQLEDCGSTNGTFLSTGERLVPGRPLTVGAGDRFYLGDARNMFEVRAAARQISFAR